MFRKTVKKLAYLQSYEAGKKINVSCLTLGRARILFMPGELFVEYQLAAKADAARLVRSDGCVWRRRTGLHWYSYRL